MAFTKIVAAGINTGGSYTLQELNTVGVMTAGTVQVGSATTVHTTGIDLGSGNITSHNINSTGIVTAASIDATSATFSGNVSIGGTLTYEDVTNIDSVGVVTARAGVHVTGGSVGIGTNNPNNLLHLSGTNTTVWPFGSDVSGSYAYSPYPHELQIQNNARDVTGSFAGIYFHSGASPDGSYISAARIAAIDSGNYRSDLAFGTRNTNFGERLRIRYDGNIGIGTDNPDAILDVRETKTAGSTQIRVYNTDNSNATTQTAEVSLTPDSRGLAGAGIKVFKENADFSTNAGRDISLALNVVQNNSQTEKVRITSGGNVGIGTDNPTRLLTLHSPTQPQAVFSIAGTEKFRLQSFESLNYIDNIDQGLVFRTGASGNSESLRITSEGYVGINESNPIHQLSVGINTSTAWDSNKNVSNTTNNDFIGLNIDNIDSGANPEVGIMLQAGASGSGQYTINCLRTGTNTADLIFRTRNGGSASREQLRIKSNGRIGIGNTNPLYAMHFKNAMASTPSYIHMEVTGSNTVGGGGGIAFDTSASNNASNNGLYLATIRGERTSADDGSNDLVFSTSQSGVAGDDGNTHSPSEAVRITASGHVGINSSIPGSVVDIMGQTTEDAIVNIRSYDRTSAIKLWPSNGHDLDRWRMAFWENNSVSDGNDYPDWSVDGYGRQFMNNNLYIGRTRSFADSPSNQYRHYGTTGPGVFIYNGVDGDNTNYSSYLQLRSCQTDTDDRNIIYYANAGTTSTVDYDAHQYFGVKASGRVQGKQQFFSGRVESDESNPDSVYYGGRGGFYAYDTTSTAVSYLLSEAGGSSTTYSAFHRTSNNDIQWKHRTSDGRMYVDAGNTTFNGADYAEYFEWSDGNTNNEDRAGYTVVLKNGNKIGIATAGDSPSSIIGVISGVPAIIGDGQDLSWQGKWLKDEFGREITTDVQYLVWNRGYERDENGNKVPVAQPNPDDQMSMQGSDQQMEVGSKLDAAIAEGNVPQFAIDNNIIMTGQRRVKNPDYNPDAIYVSREFRPEWSPVGLVGKLIVRKGQVMGDRWIKMKDINEQLEQWLVR